MKVGYLESWGNITFTAAAEAGYDTLVMAFGSINGTVVDIFDGRFAPSPTPEQLTLDIKNARAKGANKILFSVGGENNTYKPGSASPIALAASIIQFMETYGFDGIDFDLEIDTDGSYLRDLCQEIKKIKSSAFITAAPQVNQGGHETDLFLVSTGNLKPYQTAVNDGLFDCLFIQAYNNPWPMINGYTQLNVGFISASFKNLKKNIPAKTLILIGEPANAQAAGTSLFNGPDANGDIYQNISKQYDLIRSDPQFGGWMTWSINKDKENNYQFVKTVQ